jgi:DNA-binding GntR family transcriptional regulator
MSNRAAHPERLPAGREPGRRLRHRSHGADAESAHAGARLGIAPVRLSTIQNAVYEQLLKAMLSGRISPGEKLTIEGIATMMGVSLTPVRVALKKLESDNFIVIGKNRRITVTELSTENVLELLEVRLMLECRAAEIACERRNDACLDELAVVNRLCKTAESADAYLEANRQFHSTIYAQAGMPMLAEVIDALWNRASPYLHILLRSEQEFKAADFNENHNGMLAALAQRDPKAIRRWVTRDLTEAANLVKRRLETERSTRP